MLCKLVVFKCILRS